MQYNLKYIKLLHRGFIDDNGKKRIQKLNGSDYAWTISSVRLFIKENLTVNK